MSLSISSLVEFLTAVPGAHNFALNALDFSLVIIIHSPCRTSTVVLAPCACIQLLNFLEFFRKPLRECRKRRAAMSQLIVEDFDYSLFQVPEINLE